MHRQDKLIRRALALAGWLACFALAQPAAARSVAMTGSMGSKALLVIDGGAPKALAAGEVHQGVKVVSMRADQVVVEVSGKRQTIDLGGAPVSIGGGGAGAGGTQIVMPVSSGGHFFASGSINGRVTHFMVDTGATSVSMGADEARRMGIAYDQGERGYGTTANGTVPMWRVMLKSVRIQDVEVYNVEAVIVPASMSHVLLGNSFLTRFQMKRDNDTLTLTRRF